MPSTSCLVVALYLADARHNHHGSTAVVATATIPTAATTSKICDSIVAAHMDGTIVNDDQLTGKTSRTHVAGDAGIALSAAACALPTAGAMPTAVDGINADNITLWSV